MKTDHDVSFYGKYNLDEEIIMPGWEKTHLDDIYIFRKTNEIQAFADILNKGLARIYPANDYHEIASRWKAVQNQIHRDLIKHHLRFDNAGIPLRNIDAMKKWQYWISHASWDIDLACKLILYGPWLPPDTLLKESAKRYSEEISIIRSAHNQQTQPLQIISLIANVARNKATSLTFSSDILRIDEHINTLCKIIDNKPTISEYCILNSTTTVNNTVQNYTHNNTTNIQNNTTITNKKTEHCDFKNKNDVSNIYKTNIQEYSLIEMWERKIEFLHGKDKILLLCYFGRYGKSFTQKEITKFIEEKCEKELSTRTISRYEKSVMSAQLYKKYNLPPLHEEAAFRHLPIQVLPD